MQLGSSDIFIYLVCLHLRAEPLVSIQVFLADLDNYGASQKGCNRIWQLFFVDGEMSPMALCGQNKVEEQWVGGVRTWTTSWPRSQHLQQVLKPLGGVQTYLTLMFGTFVLLPLRPFLAVDPLTVGFLGAINWNFTFWQWTSSCILVNLFYHIRPYLQLDTPSGSIYS